jgi:hypothetical protein
MAKTTKSATDLAEGLAGMVAGIGEDIQRAAIAETREYVAKAVENQFLQPTGRKTYGGATPDECIVEMLREAPLNEIPRLRQALQRIEDNGGEVSEDFRAGILMAVRLFADEDYDY